MWGLLYRSVCIAVIFLRVFREKSCNDCQDLVSPSHLETVDSFRRFTALWTRTLRPAPLPTRKSCFKRVCHPQLGSGSIRSPRQLVILLPKTSFSSCLNLFGRSSSAQGAPNQNRTDRNRSWLHHPRTWFRCYEPQAANTGSCAFPQRDISACAGLCSGFSLRSGRAKLCREMFGPPAPERFRQKFHSTRRLVQ